MSSTSFNDSLGVLLLAGLFGMTFVYYFASYYGMTHIGLRYRLWGTVCSQIYAYFMHSFKDPWYIKFMVGALRLNSMPFIWFEFLNSGCFPVVYVSSYPNCGLFLLTFILRCLDTFDSALNIHILYFYMVTNFLKPQAVDVPIWCVSNGIRR